jgi:hypothetical protein
MAGADRTLLDALTRLQDAVEDLARAIERDHAPRVPDPTPFAAGWPDDPPRPTGLRRITPAPFPDVCR